MKKKKMMKKKHEKEKDDEKEKDVSRDWLINVLKNLLKCQ